MIKDLRTAFLFLAKMIGHFGFFTVPVDHISTGIIWTEVQEGAFGTHDVWVLLAPFGLTSNLDYRIGILIDLKKSTKCQLRLLHVFWRGNGQ